MYFELVLCSLSFCNSVKNYFFFLCLFFFRRFLRLWVAILWAFLFFPLGISKKFTDKLFLNFVYKRLSRFE